MYAKYSIYAGNLFVDQVRLDENIDANVSYEAVINALKYLEDKLPTSDNRTFLYTVARPNVSQTLIAHPIQEQAKALYAQDIDQFMRQIEIGLTTSNIASADVTNQLHEQYNQEFERYLNKVHPKGDLDFEWVATDDAGGFKDPMVNGAWIMWLALTGKA